MYSTDPNAYFAYWALYCAADPPLTADSVLNFRQYRDQHVRFVRFDPVDQLSLPEMYAMVTHKEHPRPYFNRSVEDGPQWMQVEYLPAGPNRESTNIVYYDDYDLSAVLRTLNIVECDQLGDRRQLEKTLRAGIAAIVIPHGAKPSDSTFFSLLADPATKDVIVLDDAGKRIDRQLLQAPEELIKLREKAIVQHNKERKVKPSDGKEKPGIRPGG
jgi:hypothetical protein